MRRTATFCDCCGDEVKYSPHYQITITASANHLPVGSRDLCPMCLIKLRDAWRGFEATGHGMYP